MEGVERGWRGPREDGERVGENRIVLHWIDLLQRYFCAHSLPLTVYLGVAEHTPIYGMDTPILGGKVYKWRATRDLGLRRDVLLLITHIRTALRTRYPGKVSFMCVCGQKFPTDVTCLPKQQHAEV